MPNPSIFSINFKPLLLAITLIFGLLLTNPSSAEARSNTRSKSKISKFTKKSNKTNRKKIAIIASSNLGSPQNSSSVEHYFLMDSDTKEILLAKNADEQIVPSSMTKLMTAYVVFDQVKKGNISLAQTCSVDKDAWKIGGSSMFLNYGDLVSVDELLKGLLAVSGNDAAIALADNIAGNVKNFADLMNITATRLKMKNSHFKNPHGLNDEGHYSSVRDLAILASRLYQDFPEFSHYLEIPEFTYGKVTQKNRNPLIRNHYEGIVGGKTGHTNEGGYGVVAVVKRGNRRLIAVVNKANSSSQRAKIITALVDYGFNNFRKIDLFSKGDEVLKIPAWLGNQAKIAALASDDISFNLSNEKSVSDISAKAYYKTPLIAPINAGQKIGTLQILVSGKKKYEIDLLAKDKLQEVGMIRKIKAYLIYNIRQISQKFSK